jgi:outer membrane protein OmpA-like peptidoglycan-associated protein
MRAKPMIWAASIGVAVVVAVAAAPLLHEQLGIPGYPAFPQVLVTGSTHTVPVPVGEEAALESGSSETASPEEAAPEGRLVTEEDRSGEAPVDGVAGESPDPFDIEPTETAMPEIPTLIETPKDLTPKDLMTILRSGDTIELVGAIARLEERDVLVAAARQAFPTSAIDARLVQEANLPAGREEAGLLAISALSRLSEGRAEVVGSEIAVTGRALYAQTPELLAARLDDTMPEGWTVSLDIEAPERIAANGGAQCQQRIVERLTDDQISFAVAAATLAPDAEPLIDELAEILTECPEVAVEVAGHTDSDGSEAANRRLSQARAAAVRQALSARGVETDRLSAVGYGQAQPIAPNDTPENKARNRRIELIVIE